MIEVKPQKMYRFAEIAKTKTRIQAKKDLFPLVALAISIYQPAFT